MRSVDLEHLRRVLQDDSLHIALGIVDKVEVLSDSSKARAKCRVLPDEFEVIAEQSWDAAGPEAGVYQLAQKEDLVLIAFLTETEDAYILRSLSSKSDKLPSQVKDGHLVAKALSGKKAYLASDTGVFLGKGGSSDPGEPLVLGEVMKSFMTDLIAEWKGFLGDLKAGPVATGNLGGPCPTDASLASKITAREANADTLKADYVDTASSNVVSQISYTERGD